MSEITSSLAEGFSITRGGPLHWLLIRLGHAGEERQRVVRRALAAILITWLPLLVLSLVQGQAYGPHIKIPFLRDLAVNVRFLIAVPILILAESGIDQRWRALVLHFLGRRLEEHILLGAGRKRPVGIGVGCLDHSHSNAPFCHS